MFARPIHRPVLFADRRHATAWVGILMLLLALLIPQFSLEAAEAAQTLTSQQEPCEDGFVRDPQTGECEREPQRVPNQITAECPAGTEREPATGACIPVSQPDPTVVDERPLEPTIDDVQVEPTSPSLPTGPTEVAAEPTVAPPPVGYVQAIKRACPDDFVPDETTTITELQNTCLDPLDGVPFSVVVSGALHTTIPTDATGLSQLGSAPVGDVLLVEEIPAGFGEPIVYCADDYAFAPFEHSYTEEDRQEIVDGTGIAWTLAADTLLQCYFYNVAAQGPDGPGDLTTQNQAEGEAQAVALTNFKTRCPQGAPHAEFSLVELMELCTAAMEDVEFTLDDGQSAIAVTTDAQGVAAWVNPPAGEVTIQETIPDGYGDPYVSCRAVPQDENGLMLWMSFGQVPNGLLELDLGDVPASMECHWTNVLAEESSGNTVSLGKWRCPQGIPPDETDLLFYTGSCTTAHDDIDFTLSHASGNHPATTVDGEIEWTGVPVGDLVIQETLPPGYTDPIVFCLTTSGAGGGDPELVPAPDGLVALELPKEGWSIHCWYFNIPDPDASSVTVSKWGCPPGLEAETEDLQDWLDTCANQPSGIEFTVTDANGSSTRALTGSETWFGTAPGDVTITEHTPPYLAEPYVFCEYSGTDEGALVSGGPDLIPVTGSTVELSLPFDQYALECWFFNGPDEVDNSITNDKFLCPPGYDFDAMGANPPVDCTELYDGVTFTLADGNAPDPDATGQSGDNGPGRLVFDKIDPGTWTVTEEVPPGIVDVLALCPGIGNGPVFSENPPRVEFDVEEGDHWGCQWFNVPGDELGENTVEIRKWKCPEGTDTGQTQDWYEATCLTPHNGVEFTVSSDIGIAVQETAGGVATFPGLPEGTVGIQETIPDGYGPPIVFCGIEGNPQHYPAPTGHWEFDFDAAGGNADTLVCVVYNIPGEPGSVTIEKWTCPPGYDLFAAGADPKMDCTEATNGIDFQFGPSGGAAVAELQTTGDVIDGGVVFDDLEPDVYKATEAVPEGIAQVFVVECTGHIMGVLQPYPLSMGNVLDNIDLDAGEHLVCDWYNVPEVEGGELTVIKHICATETFVSEIDCEIFEDGATFDLLYWTGTWDVVGSETTDGFGRIHWTDLPHGEYWLDEHDGEWCHIASDELYEDGPWFLVLDNQETVVHVYNCDKDWTTTTIPEKYPNTGAAPDDPPTGQSERLPTTPLLAGLLATPLSRRRLAALAAGGLGLAATGAFAQESTPPAGGTPVATGSRGPVPTRLELPTIEVDAPVEVLETVGGVMQQPTDAMHAAWYKESARLGEIGNIWIAAHLNWWDSPVAVFTDLHRLQPGNEVVLRDADETAYTYLVEWIRQESNLAPPREEVLGMTDHEAVTLITCGGEWDATISEYNARTVVRATRAAT